MKYFSFILLSIVSAFANAQGFERIIFGKNDTSAVCTFAEELKTGKYTAIYSEFCNGKAVGSKIIEFDNNGNKIFATTLENINDYVADPKKVIRMGDNHLLLVGNARNISSDETDILFMHTDTLYQVQSAHIVNNSGHKDIFTDIIIQGDSVADILCRDSMDSYIVRVRLNGQLIQQTVPGYPAGPTSFVQVHTSYYVLNSDNILGFTVDSLKPLGTLFDQFEYNQTHNYPFIQRGSIVKSNDSTFYSAGYYFNFFVQPEIQHIGISFWNKNLEPTVVFDCGEAGMHNGTSPNCFVFSDIENAYVAGYSMTQGNKSDEFIIETKIVLYKTNLQAGYQKWSRKFYEGYMAFPDYLSLTSDGGCLVSGSRTDLGSGRCDFTLLKLDKDGNYTPDAIDENLSQRILSYPNPCKNVIIFDLPASDNYNIVLFDLSGREVEEFESVEGNKMVDVNRLSNGTFVAKISQNGKWVGNSIVVKCQ